MNFNFESVKILKNQSFEFGKFRVIPIRSEDRYKIMQWRNEQIYHLRQNIILTKKDQDKYFNEVVSKQFIDKKPKQILFSFLKGDECIGYGGLVHINWIDMHAEISFLINTELEKTLFIESWQSFLPMIEEVAFNELNLNKIFTYTYEFRKELFSILTGCNYNHEATLLNHVRFENKFINVEIHSKLSTNVYLRKAMKGDEELTYRWFCDDSIRKYSFNKDKISFEQHCLWFNERMNDPNTAYFIVRRGIKDIGSFRGDLREDEVVLSFLLDVNFQGKGIGISLLKAGCKKITEIWPNSTLVGYVRNENKASSKIFERLRFSKDSNTTITKYILKK